MGIRSDDDESFAHPSDRKRLSEEQLRALEAAIKTGTCKLAPHVLSELLRVYREAMRRDDTDDYSPYEFFFKDC